MTISHTGYRRLAVAVINQAFQDAKHASFHQDEAQRFLTQRSPVLDHWCWLAGINPAALVASVRIKFADAQRVRVA